MISIRLTPTQVSALECSWIERPGSEPAPYDTHAELVMRAAWSRAGWLDVEERDAMHVWRELIDLCNGEDATAMDANAEPSQRRAARGASLALGNLAEKVLRAGVAAGVIDRLYGRAAAGAM